MPSRAEQLAWTPLRGLMTSARDDIINEARVLYGRLCAWTGKGAVYELPARLCGNSVLLAAVALHIVQQGYVEISTRETRS
ncbi:uncharacterized protein L969DRAFT_84828 [Mixia osmundae IAM 14324]|uniref:uncharacterized protein n=1 Tax=Mixia osmundae (strain CBS 9802 / IAM 14324 / JCM 22182 / KY 12970) TaxID=764103 RepID=UPI0004A5474E|nr:uncharacterized protein L969DRAFT_84828 [Mixia osmundae IAM 14324]KEI42939.1 hypothetical protein L969DRAFT_84828 [Mixia osmundae IAM 14324]